MRGKICARQITVPVPFVHTGSHEMRNPSKRRENSFRQSDHSPNVKASRRAPPNRLSRQNELD
jgi:hypothetical protein